ncbi:MAG: hypothetical protein ACYTXI_41945 [Nostoc sp.]
MNIQSHTAFNCPALQFAKDTAPEPTGNFFMNFRFQPAIAKQRHDCGKRNKLSAVR